MSKNNQKNYDPNYFLASLGNGGLVVTFFMYLMFMIKHPETPMPTFEDILPVITGTNLVAKISTILVLLGIAYFVFNNIYYLIWNIKRYMNFRLSPEFTKLKSSNAEVTLISIPLALAMSVNALIVAAVVFVPNLWSYVEYMFPIAIVLFSIIGIYGIKIFAEYFSRIIVEGDFDFDKNNNLSQMIAVFSFIMIGAGFSGPAAMSKIKVVSSISLLVTIFFTSIALAILFIKLVIGFKSILEKGISKEGAPSFLVIIPILTIFGIILVRVTSGVFHTFLHSSPNPIIMFLMLGILVSIQIIVAFIGYKILNRTDYSKEYIYGNKMSSGSYALICPGVAFMVLGMFFIHWGLVKTGILTQFSLVYYILLVPYVYVQFKTIKTLRIINKKHMI